MARPKVSRAQSLATVMGSRNSPNDERIPNPVMDIRQPAMITISGVRQFSVARLTKLIFSGGSRVFCRRYLFFQSGFRFWEKAAIPSFWAWVANTD